MLVKLSPVLMSVCLFLSFNFLSLLVQQHSHIRFILFLNVYSFSAFNSTCVILTWFLLQKCYMLLAAKPFLSHILSCLIFTFVPFSFYIGTLLTFTLSLSLSLFVCFLISYPLFLSPLSQLPTLSPYFLTTSLISFSLFPLRHKTYYTGSESYTRASLELGLSPSLCSVSNVLNSVLFIHTAPSNY